MNGENPREVINEEINAKIDRKTERKKQKLQYKSLCKCNASETLYNVIGMFATFVTAFVIAKLKGPTG